MAQRRRDQSPGLGAVRTGAGELGDPSPSPPWDGCVGEGDFYPHVAFWRDFPAPWQGSEQIPGGDGASVPWWHGEGRAAPRCERQRWGSPRGLLSAPCWSRGAPGLSACQMAPLPGSSTAGADICASSPAWLRSAPRHGAGGSPAGSLRVAFPCHQPPCDEPASPVWVLGGETEAAGREAAELSLDPHHPHHPHHPTPHPGVVLSCRALTSGCQELGGGEGGLGQGLGQRWHRLPPMCPGLWGCLAPPAAASQAWGCERGCGVAWWWPGGDPGGGLVVARSHPRCCAPRHPVAVLGSVAPTTAPAPRGQPVACPRVPWVPPEDVDGCAEV